MAIKVYWTHFSKIELREIFLYHKKNASLKVAQKLVLGITQEVLSLSNNVAVFQNEELLMDRVQDFRFLVYKNYKIIYFFNTSKNRIDVVDIFDCRQHPVKIRRTK